MKVFLSWSGPNSKKVALVFHDWLPSVIQAIEPYMSSEDIDKGGRWDKEISRELEETSYGIVCITPDNIAAPWINYEAGALSKALDTSFVSPFLLGVKNSDLSGPLARFQTTLFEQEEIKKLLHSMNKSCPETTLSEIRLNTIFEKWWPDLEKRLSDIYLEINKSIPEDKSVDTSIESNKSQDILEELLELSRSQQRILRSPHELFPRDFIEFISSNISNRPTPDSMLHRDLSLGYEEMLILLERSKESQYIPFDEFQLLIKRLEKPLRHLLHKRRSTNMVKGQILLDLDKESTS